MIAIIVIVRVNVFMLDIEEEKLKATLLNKLVNDVEETRNLQNIQVLICRDDNIFGNNVKIEAYFSNGGLKDVSSIYKVAISGAVVSLGLNPLLGIVMREISGHTHLTFPKYQEATTPGSDKFGQ